jgi:hypothetical protein
MKNRALPEAVPCLRAVAGALSKRRKLLEWPHHVLVPTPELGHGQRLNNMHEFCRGMDYQTASASGPGKQDAVWWCFKSEADADAFKVRWADDSYAARAERLASE